ncbi:cytochrome c biogenesis CcdA family protein [Cuneatibacter caecimuris]|uniref:Cytochrome c-type biogenesis protein n=1 Tax=Cuneatibacter caecimuris TaxID=1796618 RepID=A0A4Q7PMF5_9FIRM|nr:cytochrome c biogenesis protein CcdA [Cuneatibacter caecimuris]RZT01913.1 cytochrome c-type biogenesis protein [Cuneatibacter caecimuris]
MAYFITFLEGLVTFVSPCLLPMLPIYVMYFAGGRGKGKLGTLKNAFGFVLGFSAAFIILGAFAGSIGVIFRQYQFWVNIVCGLIVILFGLNFLGVFRWNLFRGGIHMGDSVRQTGFFSSVLFGLIFSIGWTPCVGAFLGSALMLASQQGSVWEGMLLLLCYSLGLGIPFLISAILIEKLQTAFSWIKRHYQWITRISGALLILVGILMMTGLLGAMVGLLSSI